MTNNKVPQVGQKVAVLHRSKGTDKAKLDKGDIEVRHICAVYMGVPKVRDHVGDCWEVAPNDEKMQHVAAWKTLR